jgi:hypothetical protein
MARKNTSRAEELNIVINIFEDDALNLLEYLKQNPNGGIYNSNGKKVFYGKIERLLPFVTGRSLINLDIQNIKEVYHIDTVSKNVKENVIKDLNIDKSFINKNVDLLIINEDRVPYLISVKDSKNTAKLGQQSTERIYHNAILKGGLLLEISFINEIPNSFEFSKTSLSKEQFNKLNLKDKEFAFLKSNYREEWDRYVLETYDNAYRQLDNFGQKLISHKETFISFLKIVLTGSEVLNEVAYILINGNLIKLKQIFETLRRSEFELIISSYTTKNKKSLIIEIKIDDVIYGVTKIEPSFDGAKANVSQTKGIIYYFQEYTSVSGKCVWDLIKMLNN